MKNNLTKIVILVIVLSLTACTRALKDGENKPIIYEKTGQSVTANILCRPTNEEVKKIYKDNNVSLTKIPECKDFKINQGGYDGLWTSLFVKPLAWLILQIGKTVNNYGISLIIVSILIRLLLYPVTKGTAQQSENMKRAKPEIDNVEKRYKNKKDQEDTMKKTQEILSIYKKHNINPFSGCLFAIIQLPLFFAFFEAINRVPAIFEGRLLTFQLGTTPFVALQKGHFEYLILVVLLVLVTHYSFKLNKTASLNAESQKQMEFMSKFMIVFILIASFKLSTAISIYWIASSLFTILQNEIVKRRSEV
jgi:YidC/Oxa1 family membrane protein insertase